MRLRTASLSAKASVRIGGTQSLVVPSCWMVIEGKKRLGIGE